MKVINKIEIAKQSYSIVSHHNLDKYILITCIAIYGNAYGFLYSFKEINIKLNFVLNKG
jgi:hypothetical protein